MKEYWDAYDENFNIIEGVRLVRGEPVPDGVFHIVGETAVRHKDGTYLIMQRDLHKHLGGKWELTAGGSAMQGETPLGCAKRELLEETGISSEKFTEIKTVFHKEHHSIYGIYLCETDCDKDIVKLQKGETIAFRWLTGKELRSMNCDDMASDRTMELFSEGLI
ncbi:MAG: NUDIX domain-containing protein [Clostridia bacterium]|nr:NUDIX domain-containing protein [Clostridia bacterium]